jgi:hypothetical protein
MAIKEKWEMLILILFRLVGNLTLIYFLNDWTVNLFNYGHLRLNKLTFAITLRSVGFYDQL